MNWLKCATETSRLGLGFSTSLNLSVFPRKPSLKKSSDRSHGGSSVQQIPMRFMSQQSQVHECAGDPRTTMAFSRLASSPLLTKCASLGRDRGQRRLSSSKETGDCSIRQPDPEASRAQTHAQRVQEERWAHPGRYHHPLPPSTAPLHLSQAVSSVMTADKPSF